VGTFYTTVTLRVPEGWSVLRDADVEGIAAATDWAQELTTPTGTALAADVHDSDILSLSLVHDGGLVGSYDSYPNYFSDDEDREPPVGLPGILLTTTLGSGDPGEVEQVLRFAAATDDADDPYLFEEARHKALLTALGMPA
jgi:hypothetical protein